MLDCRANMKGKYRGKSCPHCPAGRERGEVESSQHWLVCAAYSELRQNLDPELNSKHRVQYLKRVLLVREELEKDLT